MNFIGTASQTDIGGLIAAIRAQLGATAPGGISDDALASYLQQQTQTGIAALNATSQLAQADQTNRLRMMELFGVDPLGRATDAANRWRSELTAQQGVQNERLRQELMQTLGYDPTNAGVTTSAERQAREQAAQRWAELTGMGPGGTQTLAGRAQQAEIARRIGELTGNYNGQATMEAQRLQQEAQQAGFERDLRERLQRGQLTQQESEFARTYLLQQDENRRQNVAQGAELSGFQANGALTEAARAARAGETAQRAATAAQLLGTPKDIFRAGAYFQNLGGGATGQTGVGLEGNTGVAGFTGFGSRMALPQTMTMGDMDRMLGAPQGGYTGAPPAEYRYPGLPAPPPPPAPTAPRTAPTTPRGQIEGGGGTAPGFTDRGDGAMSSGFATNYGDEPGGPVGMGAGGMFPDRAAPNPSRGAKPIPFVDPAVLEDPRVKRWLGDMREMARQDGTIQKNKGKGKVQHKATPANEPGYSKDGLLERERRALRGAARLQQKAQRGGPAGPVGAPLWPEGGTVSAMPVLQTGGAVGTSMSAPQTGSAPPSAVGYDIPAQTDRRLAAVAELLVRRGPGGLAPQTLERMSSTQKQVTEGALDALGLNWEDFEDAYAETRFANVGSALSA